MDGLGLTSRWVAAVRERESRRSDRLFDDPLAGPLAGDEGRALLAAIESDLPPLDPEVADNPYLTIRTRFLDDLLETATGAGLRQVVILAAGMDSRAFRLDWPAGTVVFELERAEVLAHKEEVLASLGATPRATRLTVAIDLRDDFARALPDETAVLRLLREVAGLAASGSLIALDIAGTGLLGLPMLKPVLDRLTACGAPWCFGTDEPAELLGQAGFADVHAVESGQVRYSRGPGPAPPPRGPAIPGFAYYLLTARRP
jgi:O-methyltransferase involved in polyketide biosynthesis